MGACNSCLGSSESNDVIDYSQNGALRGQTPAADSAGNRSFDLNPFDDDDTPNGVQFTMTGVPVKGNGFAAEISLKLYIGGLTSALNAPIPLDLTKRRDRSIRGSQRSRSKGDRRSRKSKSKGDRQSRTSASTIRREDLQDMGVTVTKIDVVLDTEQEKKREADVDVENYIDENGVPRTKPKPKKPTKKKEGPKTVVANRVVQHGPRSVGIRPSIYHRRGTPDLNISLGLFDAPKFTIAMRETALKQTIRFIKQEFEPYCDIALVLTPPKTGVVWSGWDIVKSMHAAGVDTEMLYSRDCKYVGLVARVTEQRLIDAVGAYNAQEMQYDSTTRATVTFEIIAQPKGGGGAGLTTGALSSNKQVLSSFSLHN
jgi:hypothetical protein